MFVFLLLSFAPILRLSIFSTPTLPLPLPDNSSLSLGSPEEGIEFLRVGARVVVGGVVEECRQLGDELGPVPVGHGDGRPVGQQRVVHLLHVQPVPVREGWGTMDTASNFVAIKLTQSWVAVEPANTTAWPSC